MNQNVEYNKEVVDGLLRGTGKRTLREFAATKWGAYFSGMFKCIQCGRHLPFSTVQFFNWDITRVKCYDCQGRGRKLLQD